MITFLRHIRKQLVGGSKVSRYLLYALGEIVLVVIGILIALQINTWNQHRIAVHKEVIILKNIQEEILLDTLDLQFSLRWHQSMLQAERLMLQSLVNQDKRTLESQTFLDAMGLPMLIVLHQSTFDNLQNNDISLITNVALRKKIARHFDFSFRFF